MTRPVPSRLNLFAIPAGEPFLDALAAGVLREVGGGDPVALSRATILLPTRRSARALRAAFLRAALPPGGAGALLLPRMRALAGLSTEDADELGLPGLLELAPAVDPLRRQAELAAMVLRLPRPLLRGGASPEQAWQLAAALAALLDEIALEETDLALLAGSPPEALVAHWLAKFSGLVEGELATHWEITTRFLGAVFTDWQRWLVAQGLLDVGVRRVQALLAQTRAWQDRPPAALVVAAGIGAGGTIPAAVGLLRVLVRAEHGRVVLQGVPPGWDDGLWEAVGAAATHPCCGVHRLLAGLEATMGDVGVWGGMGGLADGPPP